MADGCNWKFNSLKQRASLFNHLKYQNVIGEPLVNQCMVCIRNETCFWFVLSPKNIKKLLDYAVWVDTLLGTNISHQNSLFEGDVPFPVWWDMLVPWRVFTTLRTLSPYVLGTHPTRVVHPQKIETGEPPWWLYSTWRSRRTSIFRR